MNNNEQNKINIYCILRDVLKDLWVAILVGVAVFLLVHVGAKMTYEPTYTSQTTFVVSAKGSSYGPYASITKIAKLTEVFEAVMDSQVLKKLVCQDLGIDSFDGTINIHIVPETNLLTVSVTADSPEVAFRLLKSLLKCYPIVGNDVLGEVVLETFEAPEYPSVPSNTRQYGTIRRNGFLLGMGVMLAILALISYFKDTVKNVQDIPTQLETTALAVLGHEKKRRKKKHIFILDPTVGFGYVETVKKIRTKLLYKISKTKKNIIFVTSTINGEGKSTVAINLAESLAQRYEKVLLIDGDLQKPDMYHMLGIMEDSFPNWGKYLVRGRELSEAVYKPEKYHFDVLLNGAVVKNASEHLASEEMESFLKKMSKKMDVIIIDGPPAMKRSDAEVWARNADISLLVVKQNTAEVCYINDTIDMLNSYGEGLLGCIFNDVLSMSEIFTLGYGYGYKSGYGYYGYGKYGRYGKYGKYGKYGNYYRKQEKGENYESDGTQR